VSATAWGADHPPRWYAAQILALRPELRERAMDRVPEHLRDIVAVHVERAGGAKAGAARPAVARAPRQGVEAAAHTCHWPGCEQRVPPRMWGCREHWYRLPEGLRKRIWAAYRPGQEVEKNPSREYLEAARAARGWILGQQAAA
jgi:hypothetical protein